MILEIVNWSIITMTGHSVRDVKVSEHRSRSGTASSIYTSAVSSNLCKSQKLPSSSSVLSTFSEHIKD
jgi:hypothetical protein